MAKECFCGCGRSVSFGRKRLANSFGRQMDERLALFKGSVERTPDPEHDPELRELIAAGPRLRENIRARVHGDIDRDQMLKDEALEWMKRANEHWGRMAKETAQADYAGWNAHKQSHLIRTGISASATIVNVEDTGTTINDDPRVKLTLRVEPPDGGAPFELQRKLLVSRVAVPKKGEHVQVYYDPNDHSTFTFHNPDVTDGSTAAAGAAAPAPLDPVAQIARLAELHEKGALSDAEFAAAKQKLIEDL
jgi:hypothetical protein